MKWITVQGQDREGKGLHYLIHGAHDLQEGERVLVFPSADRRIPYAAAKGLAIEPGTRVVAVPHTKMPWSRITTSIFANDALPPTANFEVDGTFGYQPFEVSFVDLSYGNPPVYAWEWDFGDGKTSTEQHPRHTYQELGWFTVTLRVTNGLGSDTIRREALIFSGVDYPGSLTVRRVGAAEAAVEWIPGENNTSVVITRRHDFYPPHPNNGARVYYGAASGSPITDGGLDDPEKEYFYRIWGIRDGVLSDGYRSATATALEVDSPISIQAWRAGATFSELRWVPGANNSHVLIVRRSDTYPAYPGDGVQVYSGAAGGSPYVDEGLDPAKSYYYRVWGIRDGVLSEGYQSAMVTTLVQSPPLHLCDPWRETMPGRLYQVNRGPFEYYWDGAGSVYATGSPDNVSGFRTVSGCGLNIYGPKGWAQPNLWSSGGTITLNNVLNPGRNEIYYGIINFETVYTGMATPLWIMRAL